MREIITAWRSEIAAELETARAELAACVKALSVAETEAAAAKLSRRALVAAINRLGSMPTLAGCLAWRANGRDAALSQADGTLSRAKNELQSCQRRIQDFEDGLRQLEGMAEREIIEVAA